jgi:hypothetical protein
MRTVTLTVTLQATIRRLGRRGGVQRISGVTYKKTCRDISVLHDKWDFVKAGARLRVHFRSDKAWYAGIVRYVDRPRVRVYVHFDGGQKTWVQCSTETVLLEEGVHWARFAGQEMCAWWPSIKLRNVGVTHSLAAHGSQPAYFLGSESYSPAGMTMEYEPYDVAATQFEERRLNLEWDPYPFAADLVALAFDSVLPTAKIHVEGTHLAEFNGWETTWPPGGAQKDADAHVAAEEKKKAAAKEKKKAAAEEKKKAAAKAKKKAAKAKAAAALLAICLP